MKTLPMKTLFSFPAKLPLFAALVFLTTGCASVGEEEGEFAAPFDITETDEAAEGFANEADEEVAEEVVEEVVEDVPEEVVEEVVEEVAEEVVEEVVEEVIEEEFAEVDLGALETVEDKASHLAVNIGDRIFFEVARSGLLEAGQETVGEQADFLNENPELDVTIEGHCDERGTREYNVALGLRRANAMRDALVGAGVDPQRIQVISYGKERPVATCSRETCWKLNRRAVLTIDGAGEESDDL